MTDPFEFIRSEVLGAVDAGFHLVPIVMSATIPDLCSALESNDGRATRDRYKCWFDTWLKERMSFITADDCYSFRCGIIHQGRLGDLKNEVSRVIFVTQENTFLTNCKFHDAYVYSVRSFCKDMLDAAEKWYAANGENPSVIANIPKMMTLYPTGLFPYFGNTPVVA